MYNAWLSRKYEDEFREYVKPGGNENGKTQQSTFVTLTVSTAECECVFKSMNS